LPPEQVPPAVAPVPAERPGIVSRIRDRLHRDDEIPPAPEAPLPPAPVAEAAPAPPPAPPAEPAPAPPPTDVPPVVPPA
jgi:hypothetical protein